jgi:hypothetical protein
VNQAPGACQNADNTRRAAKLSAALPPSTERVPKTRYNLLTKEYSSSTSRAILNCQPRPKRSRSPYIKEMASARSTSPTPAHDPWFQIIFEGRSTPGHHEHVLHAGLEQSSFEHNRRAQFVLFIYCPDSSHSQCSSNRPKRQRSLLSYSQQVLELKASLGPCSCSVHLKKKSLTSQAPGFTNLLPCPHSRILAEPKCLSPLDLSTFLMHTNYPAPGKRGPREGMHDLRSATRKRLLRIAPDREYVPGDRHRPTLGRDYQCPSFEFCFSIRGDTTTLMPGLKTARSLYLPQLLQRPSPASPSRRRHPGWYRPTS